MFIAAAASWRTHSIHTTIKSNQLNYQQILEWATALRSTFNNSKRPRAPEPEWAHSIFRFSRNKSQIVRAVTLAAVRVRMRKPKMDYCFLALVLLLFGIFRPLFLLLLSIIKCEFLHLVGTSKGRECLCVVVSVWQLVQTQTARWINSNVRIRHIT